jgi:hypothetical protein
MPVTSLAAPIQWCWAAWALASIVGVAQHIGPIWCSLGDPQLGSGALVRERPDPKSANGCQELQSFSGCAVGCGCAQRLSRSLMDSQKLLDNFPAPLA